MRVVAVSALREFWGRRPEYADAKMALESWYREVKKEKWSSPADVKAKFGHASLVGKSRFVFNIAGNKYRLVAHINYKMEIVYIRFIGTHKEYDKINVAEV